MTRTSRLFRSLLGRHRWPENRQIRLSEVIADAQDRKSGFFGQRVCAAVTKVQRGGVPALAEPMPSMQATLGKVSSEVDDCDPAITQDSGAHVGQLRASRLEDDAEFQRSGRGHCS